MIAMHQQVTWHEQAPAPTASEGTRWRPSATVLSLSRIAQMCIRVLTGSEAAVVPGLMLSRDGVAWSQPHPCVRLTARQQAAPACCTYFVPGARDLERIRAQPALKARIGIFVPRGALDARAGVAVFTLSDDDVTASPNWAGDHAHLSCAQLAADIAQHQKMVGEFDALCKLGGGVVGTDDGTEPELVPDYCFMRDVAAHDLADAQQAYRDKGCASPSA